MKKNLIKLTIIALVIVLVVVVGTIGKTIHDGAQSNKIEKHTEKSVDLDMLNGDLCGYAIYNRAAFTLANTMGDWHIPTQVPKEEPTEEPTEATTEAPTQALAALQVQAPPQAPNPAPQPPQDDNSESSMTDDEAKEKAIELNNSYRNMVSIILNETNVIRKGVGASALSENGTLTQIAMFRAAEIAKSNSPIHTRPNGLKWITVYDIYCYGYTAAAENIAWNSEYLVSPVDTWRKSTTGHYENMISSDYSKIGIGVAPGIYNGKQGFYYVQEFGD